MNTPRVRNTSFLAAFALLAAALASVAHAQTVVPNEYTNTAAPGGSGLNTFIRDSGNPRTGQLLINANQLTSLIGQSLNSISFRLFAGATTAFPATNATWADYTISIGQGVAFGSQTTTFANNFVGAPTVVRSGPLTLPAGSLPGGGISPNPFGAAITFTLPFVYTGGNLLIEIRHTGSNIVNNGANDFVEAALTTDPNYNLNFWSATATGNAATTGALNTFSIVRLGAIPEPSSAAVARGRWSRGVAPPAEAPENGVSKAGWSPRDIVGEAVGFPCFETREADSFPYNSRRAWTTTPQRASLQALPAWQFVCPLPSFIFLQ